MPSREQVHDNRWLRLFGVLLHQPQLWHINRNSVARAFAIGLFWAMIPMPFQMLPAAACAILFRANIALSIALVWITNPLTMPPIYYTCYLLGARVLRMRPAFDEFTFTWEWVQANFNAIWMPLYTGSLLAGIMLSFLSYWAVRGLWRWHVGRQHVQRQRLRLLSRRARPRFISDSGL